MRRASVIRASDEKMRPAVLTEKGLEAQIAIAADKRRISKDAPVTRCDSYGKGDLLGCFFGLCAR
jgi:hypothetical protein